ncbi:hypothetical protein VR479_07345 [Aquirufa aurantiipilula]
MSTEKKLFSETQKFNQWWLWVILVGFCAYFLVMAYKQLFQGIAFGDNPMSNEGLWVTTGIFAAIVMLFLNLKLETYIDSKGIYVRFFPFHLTFKFFAFEELEKSYVRKYSPIWEYGGWGLRYGMFGKGKAFNVSGNQGLQLEFKDGSKLLIGTQKPTEIAEVLTHLGKS